MKLHRVVAFVGLLVAMLAESGLSQDYDSTQMRILVGEVLVEPGVAPPGRPIVILYTSLNSLIAQTSTTGSGSFSFSNVRSGNYRVVARLAGYQEGSAEVSIYRGSTSTHVMPIILKPVAHSTAQAAYGTVEAAELELRKETRTRYDKAQQALQKGKFQKARDLLKRTIEDAPNFAGAYNLLGTAETLLGNYSDAETAYKHAIALSPSLADAYIGLGKALNLLHRPADALTALGKGLEISPNSSVGLFEKSQSQFLMEDYSSAERTAVASLEQTLPPPSEVHLVLANSYVRLRRYSEAARELETYLRLEPKSTSAPKAKDLLDKLKTARVTPAPGPHQ